MIKPTVGRVVWFWEDGEHSRSVLKSQPLAAMVASVLNDSLINIGYLDANGVHKNRIGVQLWNEGDPPPRGAFCAWMPYQIGQAKAQNA
jgi:hypothetical protein